MSTLGISAPAKPHSVTIARRLSCDHALTEIYSYIVEAVSREPGWHAEHFDLSDGEAATNAEATTFLEVLLYRRYSAKLGYELDFWSRFGRDGVILCCSGLGDGPVGNA